MAAIPDRAIRLIDDDSLDRLPFVNRLLHTLIDEKAGRSTGVVVGVVGEWGSGKTSILNMLDGAIRKTYPHTAIVVRFDPWLVSGRDDLIHQFLKQLIASFPQSGDIKNKLKPLKDIFLKYGECVGGLAETFVPGVGKVIGLAHQHLSSTENIHVLHDKIYEILESANVPFVVLIDELDRVDDDEVHVVAQLVRSVMDFPTISYVLAYDDKRVAEALGSGDELRGKAYLEKIVQFPISIPVSTFEELEHMFEAQLKTILQDVSINENIVGELRYKELIEILVPNIVRTPRDIKRLLGMYHVLSGMVWEEVDCIDLLEFTALMSKAPRTERMIREDIRKYIEDGWRTEDVTFFLEEREQSLEKKLNQAIFSGERSPYIERLIGFIFPKLSSIRREVNTTARSLCRRRPLLTTQRLGLLPGDYASVDVKDLISKPYTEISHLLRDLVQTEKFGIFWQRLWDVYLSEDFEAEVHRNFWHGLRLFIRKDDGEWLTQYSAMCNVSDNVSDLFRQKFFSEDEHIRKLGSEILDELFDKGDAEIVPGVVRAHFFIYGIYGWSQRHSDKFLLTEGQTVEIAEKMTDTEAQRLLDGYLMISIWRPHIIYLIRDVKGKLNEEFRSYFDSLVKDDKTLPAVALIFNGPNYVSDPETIEQFTDLKSLRQRVQEQLQKNEEGELQLEQSVKIAYEKTIEPLHR